MRSHLYKFVYFLFFVLAASACKKDSPDTTPDPSPTTVTIDNYNAITVGMSYDQVVKLLGNSTKIGTDTYTWSADNTNTIYITIFFVSNQVNTKSQTGLASPTGSGGTTAGGCPATYSGHTVYTGPRGGCYYINSKGNKTYI